MPTSALIEMQNLFWPDPAVRDKVVAICRTRQANIAKVEDAANPSAWQEKMRILHNKELAWGLAYQKDYQDFEAKQIAAGISLNDPNFYAPFFQNRPSIASSPGLSDDAVITQLEARSPGECSPLSYTVHWRCDGPCRDHPRKDPFLGLFEMMFKK